MNIFRTSGFSTVSLGACHPNSIGVITVMEKSFKLTIRAAWWVQFFQIIFALPFTIGSVIISISIFKGSMQSLPLFFLCVFLAYLGWANAFSTIQITDENVTVTVFYGRFRIHWSEVNKIVLNSPLVALIGNGKRVVLSLMLMSKESEELLKFFNQQIEERKILFEQNAIPFPLTHQNARVWR